MARPLRMEYPGAHHHVTSRGNKRRPIVRDDADREKRLDWLRRTVETYGWRLHVLVLMDNHDHLIMETPQPNLFTPTAVSQRSLHPLYPPESSTRRLRGTTGAVSLEQLPRLPQSTENLRILPVRPRALGGSSTNCVPTDSSRPRSNPSCSTHCSSRSALSCNWLAVGLIPCSAAASAASSQSSVGIRPGRWHPCRHRFQDRQVQPPPTAVAPLHDDIGSSRFGGRAREHTQANKKQGDGIIYHLHVDGLPL